MKGLNSCRLCVPKVAAIVKSSSSSSFRVISGFGKTFYHELQAAPLNIVSTYRFEVDNQGIFLNCVLMKNFRLQDTVAFTYLKNVFVGDYS